MPKNYKVSRNLAENYKSRQNAANPNISSYFSFRWICFQENSAKKSMRAIANDGVSLLIAR